MMSDSGATFGKVLRRARALERLNVRVQGLLDNDIARHCQVANVRGGQMIFACTSPGCATRLRMQAPALLQRLHATGFDDIEGIQVKMMVERF